MPPASPAATMLRNRSSNTARFLPSASASVEPASTSRVTSPTTFERVGFEVCLARMSRHCTSGRPAEIMVENWRVKMARSFVPTPEPKDGIFMPLGFSRRLETMIRFLRRKSIASSWRANVTSPDCTSPAAVRPFQTKVAMPDPPLVMVPGALDGHPDVHLVHHLFELVGLRAALERHLGRDLLVDDGGQERHVHRLHAPLLAGLHERVDLVCLALADHGLHRGRGHQHLGHHGAAAAPPARHQLLRDDALEHERELGLDLFLLV